MKLKLAGLIAIVFAVFFSTGLINSSVLGKTNENKKLQFNSDGK
ncbi:hypothetical protein AB1K89_06175 [Sporosarcina sp. 179-K 8C2 HS]